MPDISIELLDRNAESGELHEFIENSLNGTIFHHPKFLSYHGEAKYPRGDYKIAHMVFRAKGSIVGFLPGMVRSTAEGLRFDSPCGASFGGIVTGDIHFAKCEQIVDAAFDHLLKAMKVVEINIAPATAIYTGERTADYLDYLYLKRGCALRTCELTVAVKVEDSGDFPHNVFEHRVKKFIAQSEKAGLSCTVGDAIETAYAITEENRKRFDKKPTHTLEELKTISKLFPGRIVEFVTYKDRTPIASACLILCNRNVAYSFYIDQDEKHSALRPVNHVVNKVLVWLKENGYRYLDFGPSTFEYEPHRTLIFFKEGFGGRGVLKRFYQYRAAG